MKKTYCRLCERQLDNRIDIIQSTYFLNHIICRQCYSRIKNSNDISRSIKKEITPCPNEIWKTKNSGNNNLGFVIIDNVRGNMVYYSRYYINIKQTGVSYDTTMYNFLSLFQIYDTSSVECKQEVVTKRHRIIEI